jgi:putative peptide zinc metalloprotease protein
MDANLTLEQKDEVGRPRARGKTLPPQARPRLRPAYQLAGFTDRFGQDYWILKSPGGESYLNLSQAELFFVERLDGQKTVAELNIEYLKAHRALGDRLLYELLVRLQTQGFLETPLLELSPPERVPWWRKMWYMRFRLFEVDSLVACLYRRGGWLFFTPLARFLSLLVVVGGLVLFVLQLGAGGYRYLRLHTFSGWEVLGLWLPLPLWMALHESAHALVCKANGLKVGEFGVVVNMLGIPAPYVNTNDTWMAPRRVRMMVSAAGPYSNILIAGLCAALAGGYAPLQPFLLRVAAFNYLLAFVNLNPWMASDGYFLLMDFLRLPGLRSGARKFMRSEFSKVIRWRKLDAGQRIFVAYWVGSFLYLSITTPLTTWLLGISVYRLLTSLRG